MALIVFLLEQAILINDPSDKEVRQCVVFINLYTTYFIQFKASKICASTIHSQKQLNDMDLVNWFATDCLSANLRTVIYDVVLTPTPEMSPLTYISKGKYICL